MKLRFNLHSLTSNVASVTCTCKLDNILLSTFYMKKSRKVWLMHAKVFERESKTKNEHTAPVLCQRHDFIVLHHFFGFFVF